MSKKFNPDLAERILNPCRCGNVKDFDVVSSQVAEDCCEIWIQCGVCGYDPVNRPLAHVEDVMGVINNNTAFMAAKTWNEYTAKPDPCTTCFDKNKTENDEPCCHCGPPAWERHDQKTQKHS